MRAIVLFCVLIACGPTLDPPADSAEGTGNTTVDDASGSIPSTSSSTGASSSSSTTSTTGDDSGPPTDAESSEGDPLADCVIPKEETASITGTIAGQPHDFRYAWFARDGDGLCPHSLRVVLFESLTDFVDNANTLPNLSKVPHLEIAFPIEPGTSVPPGEYEGYCEYIGGDAGGSGLVIAISNELVWDPGVRLEATIGEPDGQTYELVGDLSATHCPALSYGVCGE